MSLSGSMDLQNMVIQAKEIEKFLETYLARHVSFRMLVVLEKINVP